MKKTYWARFYAWEDGKGFTVDLPDFNFATTEGSSFDEAVYMAQDMLNGLLEIYLRDGQEPPKASTEKEIAILEDIEAMGPAKLIEIFFDSDSKTALLPDDLWAELGKVSQKYGLPVNEILVQATREYLARQQKNV